MNNSDIYFIVKRFFSYYRLPLSLIDAGKTIFCFPETENGYILPPSIMAYELSRYQQNKSEVNIPFLSNAPYDSFIAIMPVVEDTFLFVGPSFSQPFYTSKIDESYNSSLQISDISTLKEISKKLPLVDEKYLADALSLLVLLAHHKEVTPKEILSKNPLSSSTESAYNTSNILEPEYEKLLLFEAQVQACILEGQEKSLEKLWEDFSASIKDEPVEYMYTEHHLMIPLLSSARHAALSGGAPKEDVLFIFHSAISKISSRGSLPINLKAVERATYDFCNLVKRNKNVPFRTELCIKCERYIDEHLCEKITASDIANYCGIDRSLIFDIFRNNYNMSLTEYIQECKMRRAKILLKHSTMSISDIASSLGFCSSSYFGKVFFSHFNSKPTEYRNLSR